MTDISDEEIEIEPYPLRQIGGQHVGTGPSGVKMTHIPSGLVAIANSDRSQHRNRAIAYDMLMGGLTSPHYRGGR
jgi:peptide chain release factor 2